MHTPFDFPANCTNPYAGDPATMEREFYRIGHGHLYDSIVAPFEEQLDGLRAECDALRESLEQLQESLDESAAAVERLEIRNGTMSDILDELAFLVDEELDTDNVAVVKFALDQVRGLVLEARARGVI